MRADPESFTSTLNRDDVLTLLIHLGYLAYGQLNSNRASGFCRYDVMLEPCNAQDVAYVLEFDKKY